MREDTFKKKYSELVQTLQAYQSAVNGAAIVSITDKTGKILYVNDKFIEVSKYDASELIGQKHSIINSGYHPDEFFKEMWETITSGKYWRGEIKNKAKDGSYYWVDTVITPVIDKRNRIFQYLSVRNIITVQKENEEKLIHFQKELIKREQQLKEAQQVAKTGSWYLNLCYNSVEWSEETYRIFEIAPGTPVTYELFLEKVHPGDRSMVNEFRRAVIKGDSPNEIEHRIITPGGIKWVNERAQLVFNASAVPIGGVGTTQDITQKKKTEDELKESETLYKSLFNNSPFPVGILDKETLQFLEVNETAVRLYGYSREEFLERTAYDMRLAEDLDKLKGQMERGEYIWDNSIRSHKKKNGDIIQVEPTITEISYKGQPALLITINDVTEKFRMQEQLMKTKMNRQMEISRVSIEAQEKSRAEIGMELHDNINQLLVASNLYLKNVKLPPGKEKKLIEQSVEIISNAIVEIRKLSWALVPPTLKDHSLKESLQELTHGFKLTQTAVEFDIKIDEDALGENMKVNIYRIVQEQINNIIKYAGASKVKISMTQQNDLLTLEIVDNGKGFDQLQRSRGIGITNIIHRAETYNGKVFIDTSPGQGCRIYIEFALTPENKSLSQQKLHSPPSPF